MAGCVGLNDRRGYIYIYNYRGGCAIRFHCLGGVFYIVTKINYIVSTFCVVKTDSK